MTDPAGPIDHAPRPPEPPWRLRATIDAAAVERVQAGLEAVFVGRFHRAEGYAPPEDRAAPFRQFIGRAHALQRKVRPLVRWLGILGLAISLAFTATGGLEWHGYRLDLFFAAYFTAVLALGLLARPVSPHDPMRPTDAILAWRPRPWTGMHRFFARRIAARTLKTARTLAPFEAQYDIGNGAVIYTRIKGDGATVQWTRPLQGWYAAGDGFTILFEDRTSFRSALILHAPCPRLHHLLEAHGVRKLPS